MRATKRNAPDGWKDVPLKAVLQEVDVRVKDLPPEEQGDIEVLSLTKQFGLIPQAQRFNKRVATENVDKYKVIRRDWIVYNPYVIWEGAVHSLKRDQPGIVSPAYPVWKVREPDGGYVDLLLRTPEVIEKYQSLSSGAVNRRRSISKEDFLAITLPLPPLPEQKKIAHILSTVQRAIEAQERIIQTTTELKKALMHKLFTEGLRNEPQKQTEIGPVPESWEVMELGEFFQIKHGFAFDGKFFKPSGEYILMTPGHFHEEGGFRDQGEKTKFFTGDIPQDYVLAKDDLVVAMTEQTSGLLGSAAFVPDDDRYLHNQRLGLVVDLDTKRLSKRFLFNAFNHPHLRVEVAKTSTGSKVKHTSPTKLRTVKVGIPPTLDEQEEIASALLTTQQKMSVATNKKAQLQDLFRTLLHELMTAKTRVQNLTLPSL